MAGGLGGSQRRTPARACEAEEARDGKTAPNAALVHLASKDSYMASCRPPPVAVHTPATRFKRKLEWTVETPRLPSKSRFAPRGEDMPSRVSAAACSAIATPRVHRTKTAYDGSVQRKPTKSVTKMPHTIRKSGGARDLGSGLGLSMSVRGMPTVVNSVEVPHYELQKDPSFWMENNVQVVIRVRPLNETEKNGFYGYNRCLKQESAQSITWIGHPESHFTFDHVACESMNQEVLFRVAGLPMVENCLAGYNSCVFAYGQTGSGKTHTMLGKIGELGVKPGPECGMTPRIFEFLISRIRAEEERRSDESLKYNCKCSFLEIYNDQIIDLLKPSSTNLQLRKDTRVGTYVENLTKREVTCVSDIITLLMQASVNRKVSATNLNPTSSRSHSVLTCTIESSWEKDFISNSRVARLNIVDLAGSERQMASGAEGERLKEASYINKSLSVLGNVIKSLVDLRDGKKMHVPYRDSKLTFLLQDSLGGNSKTLIIANVSPSLCSSNETLETLKFAQRARLIQNKEEPAVINREHVPQTHGALEAEEQCKAEVVCHLCKDRESAICEFQVLQSQYTKLLQEKENVEECHFMSQRTIKDLSSEILELKSEKNDKEKCYEARIKELEIDIQEKDSDATASLILWHKEKEALEFELSEAKDLAEQKSVEASILLAKFQEAQAIIVDANSTVKALVEVNENAKLLAEYKEKESLFTIEKDDLLSEISSLKMPLDVKEQNYLDMEKKFESSLLEANEVALELEDGIRHLKNSLAENLQLVSSDIEWMKSKLQHFSEFARGWLEENWLEIIGKDTMLEDPSLPEVNTAIPSNDIKWCNVFEFCSSLVNYHHESVMINTIANDIESFVLASELEQQKAQLQKQNLIFTEILEGLKTEATLWRVDQDLCSVAMYTLHEENSNIRSDIKNLKRDKGEVMESLLAMSKENTKLSYVVDSLESNIRSLRTDRDGKVKALMELQRSHAALCKELGLKDEVIELGISRENALKSDNDSLKHEMLHVLRKDQRMVDLVSNIDMQKLSVSIQACSEQITAQVQMYIDEQLNMVVKLSDKLDLIQVSVEELRTHNSFLQSEMARKDGVAKALSCDFSVLQESASVAKNQADQLIELTEAIKSLEHDVASKSHDLDNLVSGSQLLEAKIMKSDDKNLVLQEQLASTVGELNAISMENTDLRSQLNRIERIGYSMKEKLARKSNATERMDEELIELRSLLDDRNSLFQNLQNDFSQLSDEKQYCDSQLLMLREKLEMAQAVAEKREAIAMDARQIAYEWKAYAEEKDGEVKLLERSVEDHASDVWALENQVRNIKEAEPQRMQREELEVDLQKVRQQMPAVPSSGEEGSSMEDQNVHNEKELDEQKWNNHQSIELHDKRATKISRSKTELYMHCTQQLLANEDPRVQHFIEKLKRMQAAIRKALNNKNLSREYSWVNSSG